jgi:hypothetical protein
MGEAITTVSTRHNAELETNRSSTESPSSSASGNSYPPSSKEKYYIEDENPAFLQNGDMERLLHVDDRDHNGVARTDDKDLPAGTAKRISPWIISEIPAPPPPFFPEGQRLSSQRY